MGWGSEGQNGPHESTRSVLANGRAGRGGRKPAEVKGPGEDPASARCASPPGPHLELATGNEMGRNVHDSRALIGRRRRRAKNPLKEFDMLDEVCCIFAFPGTRWQLGPWEYVADAGGVPSAQNGVEIRAEKQWADSGQRTVVVRRPWAENRGHAMRSKNNGIAASQGTPRSTRRGQEKGEMLVYACVCLYMLV